MHGNNFSKPLPASQTQADVLRVMKKLISRQRFTIKFLYVQSHTDDIKKMSECTTTELMNIIVDDLAQSALRQSFSSGDYFDGIYPHNDFVVTMRGAKTTGPIRDALEQHWGRSEAQRSSTSRNLSITKILTSFGGTEWERQWQATPRCSGFLSPSRYRGGADPIASNYGTLRLEICALIVGLQERHRNISPDARIPEESSCSACLLPM